MLLGVLCLAEGDPWIPSNHARFTVVFSTHLQLPMDVWDEGVPAIALREISALKEVQHPNIVSLRDVFVSFNGNLCGTFGEGGCTFRV